MASSYPGGIDSLTNPAPSDSMAVVSHAGQHADANDAIEAIETELGTNPSGASASVKDRLDTLAVGPASATDNALVRFDGTGGKTVQDSGITVDDSNNVSGVGTIGSGAVTSSGAVQAAAASGFVVGSSGPRVMSGTGSPEGVVTAPVGSRWIRTDGATLGDFEYQKRSGTGSTGWVVSDGDTGMRQLSGALLNGWTVYSGIAFVQRVGEAVTFYARLSPASATASSVGASLLPSGFRPSINVRQPVLSSTLNFTSTQYADVASNGTLLVINYSTGVTAYTINAVWQTNDPWPSSLPGSAA